MLGPVKRRSQEWGWNDPELEAPDIDIDEPLYINDETAAAAVYLLNDPKFFDKTNKWINKRFKQTRNPDLIRQELATNFMNQLINGINKLPSPYKDLAAVSLEKINWESLVDPYIDPISGPRYMSEEEEFESLEKAIQMFPEEGELPLLSESEYELLEEKPISPKIRYEEQHPTYRPTHTW